MANITTTITNTAGFQPEIWAQRALKVLRAKTPIIQTCSKAPDYAGGSFKVGSALHIPYPGKVASSLKTANNAVTVNVPTGGNSQTLTLTNHRTNDVLIEDLAQAQANTNLMDRYLTSLITDVAEQMENDVMAVIISSQNTVGTAGTDVSAATLRAAKKTLDLNRSDGDGRYFIASPKDYIALLGDSGLATYFAFAKAGQITEGEIPRIYGFDIKEAPLTALMTGGGTANTVQTVTVTGSPTGGTFTLTYAGQTTAAIAYNATAATVLAALVALTNINNAANVTVTGSAGGPYTVTFIGQFSGQSVVAMTASGASLTGGSSPGITIAVATAGSTSSLAYHKDALCVAVRPFDSPIPEGGVAASTVVDPVSGLSLRLLLQYSQLNRAYYMGVDVLYGWVLARPELAVRVLT